MDDELTVGVSPNFLAAAIVGLAGDQVIDDFPGTEGPMFSIGLYLTDSVQRAPRMLPAAVPMSVLAELEGWLIAVKQAMPQPVKDKWFQLREDSILYADAKITELREAMKEAGLPNAADPDTVRAPVEQAARILFDAAGRPTASDGVRQRPAVSDDGPGMYL